MCPACFATAALVAAGTASAGGIVPLAMKALRIRSTAPANAKSAHPGSSTISQTAVRPRDGSYRE
jgi:hypothetical protein